MPGHRCHVKLRTVYLCAACAKVASIEAVIYRLQLLVEFNGTCKLACVPAAHYSKNRAMRAPFACSLRAAVLD